MTDAEYEKQRGRLEGLIKRWPKWKFGLGLWRIDYVYVRSPHDLEHSDDSDAVGVCRADWRYFHASIGWNLWNVATQNDDSLELIFVHEHMHCVLDELRKTKGGRDNEERTAQLLAIAFRWVRQGDTIDDEY